MFQKGHPSGRIKELEMHLFYYSQTTLSVVATMQHTKAQRPTLQKLQRFLILSKKNDRPSIEKSSAFFPNSKNFLASDYY